MDDHARILEKVRKLLRLANDKGASEGERDNAMRMAHAFLAKHNLDMAQVESAGQKVEGEPREKHEDQFYGRPWARMVAHAVADLFFCGYVYTANNDAKGGPSDAPKLK